MRIARARGPVENIKSSACFDGREVKEIASSHRSYVHITYGFKGRIYTRLVRVSAYFFAGELCISKNITCLRDITDGPPV